MFVATRSTNPRKLNTHNDTHPRVVWFSFSTPSAIRVKHTQHWTQVIDHDLRQRRKSGRRKKEILFWWT